MLLNTDYDMAAPRQWTARASLQWEIGPCQATRVNTKMQAVGMPLVPGGVAGEGDTSPRQAQPCFHKPSTGFERYE